MSNNDSSIGHKKQYGTKINKVGTEFLLNCSVHHLPLQVLYCHENVNNCNNKQALRLDQAELGARTSVLLAAAALAQQLSVSLSLASQCHLLCQGGGHL